MTESTDAIVTLVEFLADALTGSELVTFARRLPDGLRLARDLPEPPASRGQTADALVCALLRRGMLDREFFAALARELPWRSDQVNLIMLSYLPGPKPTLQLQEGVLLGAGRYRMEEIVGSGGFATLWRARDSVTGKAVAIKVLSRELPERDYAWRRMLFIRGAARIAALDHPHIARVIEAHRSEQGHDFCVLEFVEGRSLHAEIKAGRFSSPMAVAKALLEIGAGLAQIHETGAVHGDVSPKNVLVRELDGELSARLVDFDLVYARDDEIMTAAATGMPGTDPYAAPEWKAHQVPPDGRVDVFGLGMTLIHAFFGGPLPPSLNDPEAMDPCAFIERKLTCAPAIRAVLRKACALDRTARYPTMAIFCAELEQALAGLSVSTTSVRSAEQSSGSTLQPEPAAGRSHRWRRGVSAASAACTVIGLSLTLWSPTEPLPAPEGDFGAVKPAHSSDPDPTPTSLKVDHRQLVQFPMPEGFLLRNGFQVYVASDRGVPRVSLRLIVKAGTMDDRYRSELMSRVLEASIRNSLQRTTSRKFDDVVKDFRVAAEIHDTILRGEVEPADVESVLKVFASALAKPGFKTEALEPLKQDFKASLKQQKADPEYLADTLLGMAAYADGHPYGRAPLEDEEVDAVSVQALEAFHSGFYRSNNAFLILTGPISKSEAEQSAASALEGWPLGPAPRNPLNQFRVYKHPDKLLVHIIDRPGAEKSVIRVGNLALSRRHRDWNKLSIASAIVGDPAQGRLFRDVRVERAITDKITSEHLPRQAPGLWLVSTNTRTENTGQMLAAILQHIKRMREAPPTAAEFEAAVNASIAGFPLAIGTADQIADSIRTVNAFSLPPDYWSNYRNDIREVSVDDIQPISRRYMNDTPIIVVVGRAAEIAPQITRDVPGADVIEYDVDLRCVRVDMASCAKG